MKKHTCSKCGHTDIIFEGLEDLLIPEHLHDVWPDFLEVRKFKKAANTTRALKEVLKTLDSLSKYPAVQIEIVLQSIRNSWKDVFPLRESNTNIRAIITSEAKPEIKKELTSDDDPIDEEAFRQLQETTKNLARKFSI